MNTNKPAIYYDRGPVLSYNKLFNAIMSNRGGGKTFNFTEWVISSFKRTKKQAIWVRRYETQFTGNKGILLNNKFFSAVKKEGYFPDDEFKIENHIGYVNGEPAIYFIALSTSRGLKSDNFPDVDKIIFDEFLITKGTEHYLADEVEVFLDLVETVDRMRDEVRCFFLANSISVVNPYFDYFRIKPKPGKRFTVSGQWCIEMYTNDEFLKQKRKTRLGQAVAGTRWGDYAIENKWLLDTDTFIEKKPPKAEFMLALKYEGTFYGFWADYNAGRIYVNKQYDPSSYALYSLTMDDHAPNLLLIKSLTDSKIFKRIIFAYQNSLLRFSDQSVKQKFMEYVGYFSR